MASDKTCECVIEMALPSGGLAPRIVRCRFCEARLKLADAVLDTLNNLVVYKHIGERVVDLCAQYQKEISTDGKTQGG